MGPSTSWALVLCTCCTIHCYATVVSVCQYGTIYKCSELQTYFLMYLWKHNGQIWCSTLATNKVQHIAHNVMTNGKTKTNIVSRYTGNPTQQSRCTYTQGVSLTYHASAQALSCGKTGRSSRCCKSRCKYNILTEQYTEFSITNSRKCKR